MLNTILDIESVSEEASAMVHECRNEMITGFKSALKTASMSGDAPATSREISDRAEFLVGAMWGARITARLKGDVTAAKGVTRTVASAIRSWRAAG